LPETFETLAVAPETFETLAPSTETLPLPTFKAARGDDFDWSAECRDGGSVVLREQRATAIYRNTAGDLVIRQERAWNEEEDPFIVITQQNEQEFLDKLCDFLGIPSTATPNGSWAKWVASSTSRKRSPSSRITVGTAIAKFCST
jgi:hypothetical protein